MPVEFWATAALRLILRLRPRYWALLALVYSGRAMMPFLPAGVDGGGASGWVQGALQIFVIFWMPYMFMRAMAGAERPWMPARGLLWFVPVAIAFTLAMAALPTLMHLRFLGEGGMENAQLWFLLAGTVGAIAAARLLPLYAGTATGLLAPRALVWWDGMRGVALPFCFTVGAVYLGWKLAAGLLPPVAPDFTLANILRSHAVQALSAAYFLILSALAVAAAQHCARLQEEAPSR